MSAEPFVSQPSIQRIGELHAYPRTFAIAFVYYNSLLHAVVSREWPTAAQKATRDRFWSHFAAEEQAHG